MFLGLIVSYELTRENRLERILESRNLRDLLQTW